MTDSTPSSSTAHAPARWPIFIGIFCVSCATLLMEVGLTRIFSYTIWYHFAFITIAVALMGFGASGSIASLWPRLATSGRTTLAWTALASAASSLAVLYVTSRVEFDPMWLVQQPRQMVGFLIHILAVLIPFFCAGLTISLILSRYSAQSGPLYATDLIGAAIGCALLPLLLPVLEGAGVLTACAALFVLGAVFLAPFPSRAYYGALAFVLFAVAFAPWNVEFTPCRSKPFSWLVASRDHQVLYSHWTSVFRTEIAKFTVTKASRGLSYGSWGRSPQFKGTLPECTAIFHDAGASAMFLTFDNKDDMRDFYSTHMLSLPYRLRPGARVCIGGVGGGVDIVSALVNGASDVTGIELDPSTAYAITGPFASYSNDMLIDPRVNIQVGDARSVIRRSGEEFDVINFTAVDTITAVAAGAQVLNESYLYTVNAVSDYFDRLAPDGILCLSTSDTSGALGPARMLPRFASTVAAALEQRGITDVSKHVVVIVDHRNETPFASMLTKKEPFTPEELAAYDSFVRDNQFHYWHDGRTAQDSTVSTILSLASSERAAFLDEQKLHLTAVTDDRPFFFSFFKWRNMMDSALVSGAVEVSYLGPTGDIVLISALLMTLVLSFLVIVLPAWLAKRRDKAAAMKTSELLYFCAVGLGFMMFEIPLMQRLVLFLGYPTYSLSVVLFSLLLATGLGSYLTRNLDGLSATPLFRLLAVLLALSALHFVAGDAILNRLLYLPLATRIVIAVVAILPLGLILGAFFPLGIRALGARNALAVPLAWAANGTCSVVGTFAALLTAMAVGFKLTFAIALLLYIAATLLFHISRKHVKQT